MVILVAVVILLSRVAENYLNRRTSTPSASRSRSPKVTTRAPIPSPPKVTTRAPIPSQPRPSRTISPAPAKVCVQQNDLDLGGDNLATPDASSPEECCSHCSAYTGCECAVLFEDVCYMKASCDETYGHSQRVAVAPNKAPGWHFPQPPPQPPPPAPIPSQKACPPSFSRPLTRQDVKPVPQLPQTWIDTDPVPVQLRVSPVSVLNPPIFARWYKSGAFPTLLRISWIDRLDAPRATTLQIVNSVGLQEGTGSPMLYFPSRSPFPFASGDVDQGYRWTRLPVPSLQDLQQRTGDYFQRTMQATQPTDKISESAVLGVQSIVLALYPKPQIRASVQAVLSDHTGKQHTFTLNAAGSLYHAKVLTFGDPKFDNYTGYAPAMGDRVACLQNLTQRINEELQTQEGIDLIVMGGDNFYDPEGSACRGTFSAATPNQIFTQMSGAPYMEANLLTVNMDSRLNSTMLCALIGNHDYNSSGGGGTFTGACFNILYYALDGIGGSMIGGQAKSSGNFWLDADFSDAGTTDQETLPQESIANCEICRCTADPCGKRALCNVCSPLGPASPIGSSTMLFLMGRFLVLATDNVHSDADVLALLMTQLSTCFQETGTSPLHKFSAFLAGHVDTFLYASHYNTANLGAQTQSCQFLEWMLNGGAPPESQEDFYGLRCALQGAGVAEYMFFTYHDHNNIPNIVHNGYVGYDSSSYGQNHDMQCQPLVLDGAKSMVRMMSITPPHQIMAYHDHGTVMASATASIVNHELQLPAAMVSTEDGVMNNCCA